MIAPLQDCPALCPIAGSREPSGTKLYPGDLAHAALQCKPQRYDPDAFPCQGGILLLYCVRARMLQVNEVRPIHSDEPAGEGKMNELTPIPAGATESAEQLLNSPERFINREFSWLQFNRRVLQESQNPNHPLLERVRFLSISAANLDEFFMVRVAGLAGQVREAITVRSPDGRTPEQQLDLLLLEVARLQEDQQASYDSLMQLLRAEGIEIIRAQGLSPAELEWLEDYFMEAVFPVLTPLSIDPAHPFPFIPNLGFSKALQLRNLRDGEEMI